LHKLKVSEESLFLKKPFSTYSYMPHIKSFTTEEERQKKPGEPPALGKK
jgi:hypothetical protein